MCVLLRSNLNGMQAHGVCAVPAHRTRVYNSSSTCMHDATLATWSMGMANYLPLSSTSTTTSPPSAAPAKAAAPVAIAA